MRCLAMGLLAGVVAMGVAPPLAWGEVPEQFRVWGRRAAEHPYLTAAVVEAWPVVNVEALPEETERGFIVFSLPLFALVKPDHVPSPEERCRALAARDCPGQYGPVSFAVFPLREAELSLAVSDLEGPGGSTIAAENLDVRAVRCVRLGPPDRPEVIPLLIESFETTRVSPGRAQQFWITYYIPPDSPPGLYEGQVSIAVDGAQKLSLPLRIRVNPFVLTEPDVSFYMYHGAESDLQALRRWLVDQRCHGMNTGMVDPPVTQEGGLQDDAMKRTFDMYKQVGFARPEVRVDFWNRVTSEWLNTPDQSIGMWGAWFRYYPFTQQLDDRYVRAVRAMDGEARKRGLQLILAVADEAGSHAWTIKATQHYNVLIKAEVPDVVRELTVGGGWASNEPEHDLWKGLINIWTTNRWLPQLEIVKRDDPQAKIGLYNMAGAGSGAGGLMSARNVFGFFNWRARADGVAQWVHHHAGTPEHNYAWPAQGPEEGPVPTLRWEAVREGTKDRRYLATLEARLAGKQGPAADEAQEFLTGIAARIELRTEDYDPISGGRVPAQQPGAYDAWRDRIADFIEALPAE